tara:strand:+ start:7068 stop:7388 length:321 start_codon:yes stop_codon:yes gene_type:complete
MIRVATFKWRDMDLMVKFTLLYYVNGEQVSSGVDWYYIQIMNIKDKEADIKGLPSTYRCFTADIPIDDFSLRRKHIRRNLRAMMSGYAIDYLDMNAEEEQKQMSLF